MRKILDALKMESTREMENNADNLTKHKEMSTAEVFSEIDRANKLADVANKTTDREEFYNAINKIESILTELSKYEHKYNFSYPPSANLRDLRRSKNKQIELLEKRITEKEKENSKPHVKEEKSNNSYDMYYENLAKEKDNNLQITYVDVQCYDLRTFDFNKPFISDGHFTAIELDGENLEKAYKYLQTVHNSNFALE